MAALDHAPPPFFKRGPAPLARLIFYVLASIALFVLDVRFHNLEALRQLISFVTDPVQRLAQSPIHAVSDAGEYLNTVHRLNQDNDQLRQQVLNSGPTQLRLAQLEQENERLRTLLGLQGRERSKGQVASILYSPRDPFSRRVVVNKGLNAGIVAGQPVIDERGIIGQVTRVFPLSAQVTLITDKEQAVPVQVLRNGLRTVLAGVGNGLLELKYLSSNADVQQGDILVTSGIDGTYLAGFPVARVETVEKDPALAFAKIYCNPVASVENFGEVLILDPRQPMMERPPEPVSREVDVTRGRKQRQLKKL